MQSSHWVGDLGFGLSGMRVYRIFLWLFRIKLNYLSLALRLRCFFLQLRLACSQCGVQPVMAPQSLPGIHWQSNRKQLPSHYTIDIDGKELHMFLLKKEEAADPITYKWIKDSFGLEVAAVGVAAGDGAASYPVPLHVFEIPMYHKGRVREEGIQKFWQGCKAASSQGKAVIVHCNQSFHRGPICTRGCPKAGEHSSCNQ